jgi:hypothetical protein
LGLDDRARAEGDVQVLAAHIGAIGEERTPWLGLAANRWNGVLALGFSREKVP